MQRKQSRLSGRTALALGGAGLVLLAILNYQAILDEYALASYTPAAEVVGFESRITITREARSIFYRAQPKFSDKASFNVDCETRPHELELGCFFRSRIYVLKIMNQSLASEMDVVSAHELLHAAWVRMSANERTKLSNELFRVYGLVGDEELKQRMASYAKSEPGEEGNELHSILGTEFSTLSPLLEEHYRQYFANRQQVVSAHKSYEAVFNSRRGELERQLANIRSDKAQLSVINRQLDVMKAAGQISAYNELVPRQNRLVDSINVKIDEYRRGVEEYNALSKSLDSSEITDTESAAQ